MEEMTENEKKMNEEIILLRNELSEAWWTSNGWKFKDRNKYDKFSRVKNGFLAMPISLRKDSRSYDILEKHFIALRGLENDNTTKS